MSTDVWYMNSVLKASVVALLQQWTDDRLTWSRSESRLKKLDLSADEVWTPGVAIDAR